MLSNNLKVLAKHSSLYSLAGIASNIVSIVMLPVYTRFLTKTDYGVLELVEQMLTVCQIVLVGGLNFSISKFFHAQGSAREQGKVISTATLMVAAVGAVGIVVGFFVRRKIAFIVFGDSAMSYYVSLMMIILFISVLNQVCNTQMMAKKQSVLLVKLNLAGLVLAVSSNILTVVVLRQGAEGMLYSKIASTLVVTLLALSISIRSNGLGFSKSLAKKMLVYGLPMMPVSIMATFMHNVDRYLVRIHCSLSEVGLYSLGYRFPSMANQLILGSFNQVWSSSVLFSIAKQEDAEYQFGKITTYAMTGFVFVQFCMAVFGTTIVSILAAPDFFVAHKVIPFVALGYCFHAFYTFFTVGAFIKSKTWVLNLAYLPPCVLNIALNNYLLPKYGSIAAAWVTTATYLCFAIMAYVVCRKTMHIKFQFGRLTALFVLAATFYYASVLVHFDSLALNILVQTSIVLLFGVTLLSSGYFTPQERQALMGKIKELAAAKFSRHPAGQKGQA
jgi:O-antigen/teichoic acid export membrane protein